MSKPLHVPRWVGEDVHAKIANDVWPKGVDVICPGCMNREHLDVEQIAECLREGWPKCCGRTMQVEGVK